MFIIAPLRETISVRGHNSLCSYESLVRTETLNILPTIRAFFERINLATQNGQYFFFPGFAPIAGDISKYTYARGVFVTGDYALFQHESAFYVLTR